MLFNPVYSLLGDHFFSYDYKALPSERMIAAHGVNLLVVDPDEALQSGQRGPAGCMDFLMLHDQGLTGKIHGVLPACESANSADATFKYFECRAIALAPEIAFCIGGLKFSMFS